MGAQNLALLPEALLEMSSPCSEHTWKITHPGLPFTIEETGQGRAGGLPRVPG